MRLLRVKFLSLVFVLLMAACGPLPDNVTIDLSGPTQDVNQIVAATFDALTAQAGQEPLATPTAVAASTEVPGDAAPAASTGSISGSLSYPSEGLPALTVVAYQVGTANYQYVITNAGQGSYQIDNLPPGTYHVVAYTGGGAGLAGGYTQAVPCGLSVDCSDHSLIDVTVTAGRTADGVDPGDWYAPDGAFPPFAEAPAAADGSISGHLMYPSNHIPPLRIVALQPGGGQAFYYVDTIENQTTYQIDNLPPGTYHVVAYTQGPGSTFGDPIGGYSQMVPCGLQYGCDDHTLIDVTVSSNTVTTDVDPNDYYADPGTFPPYPGP